MFKKKHEVPTSKPDPPSLIAACLLTLIVFVGLGFLFCNKHLSAINAQMQYEERQNEQTIPQLPIAPYRR